MLTLDSTCAVLTVFPFLFLFLSFKERQIHIGRIDLVWANCYRVNQTLGESRPDTLHVGHVL